MLCCNNCQTDNLLQKAMSEAVNSDKEKKQGCTSRIQMFLKEHPPCDGRCLTHMVQVRGTDRSHVLQEIGAIEK